MTSRCYGQPLASPRGTGSQADVHGEPVYHPRKGEGAYVRLLVAMRALTDIEPDATFTDEDVLVETEQLFEHLRARVRQATGRHLSPADAEAR